MAHSTYSYLWNIMFYYRKGLAGLECGIYIIGRIFLNTKKQGLIPIWVYQEIYEIVS
jgi:hypothetical protein